MKANAVALLAIFEKKMRIEVPPYQRQYVWDCERQWKPLWEDIARKFSEFLDGRKDGPVHFLGAMVLDQKQTPTTHVEKRYVIDGQQRLTTLQIFLAAFRDFCQEHECFDLANEAESFTLNKGMMADPNVDRFKVWPTQLDRAQFTDVITSGSRAALEQKHPLQPRRSASKTNPRARMVEAYLFFHDAMTEFFIGSPTEPPLAAEQLLATRLDECFQGLKAAIQIVVIDLDQNDDPQVIFETLNARGEPLLPADLVRNFIFLRAARQGEDPESLYLDFWKRFDDPFWRQEVRQGRLSRPYSDLYMQHFLASRQGLEIPIKHLFVEYKSWIEQQKPFATVREEVETLARQGEDFRRIVAAKKGDVLFNLVTFLNIFDIRTTFPLLLHLLDTGISDNDWAEVSRTIESYLLRRTICGLATKNYSRVFLGITKDLHGAVSQPKAIRQQLASLTGESAAWPSDSEFLTAWHTYLAYQRLQKPKIVHILRRLNDTFMSPKSERITIENPLTVEHILPQSWLDNWPLPDGSKGLAWQELSEADEDDPRRHATKQRNAALHTFGNLTILTKSLNTSVSNSSWSKKKHPLLQASLLPLNQQLHDVERWNEEVIEERSKKLFKRAVKIWPGPGVSSREDR